MKIQTETKINKKKTKKKFYVEMGEEGANKIN